MSVHADSGDEIITRIRASSKPYGNDPAAIRLDESALRYLSERQASAWLRIGQFDNTHTRSFECHAIGDHIERIVQECGMTLEVVDLGPGSGVKAAQIIRALTQRDISVSTYVPVDVSTSFLDRSSSQVMAAVPEVHISPIRLSFEDLARSPKLLRDSLASPRSGALLLFLGNTFSNFEPQVIAGMLYDICAPRDLLLVGIRVRTADGRQVEEAMIAEYESYGPEFTLEFGRIMGLRDHEMSRRVVFDRTRHAIEIWLDTDAAPAVVKQQYPACRHVLVCTSFRHSRQEITQGLAPFFGVEMWVSPQENEVVLACRRR